MPTENNEKEKGIFAKLCEFFNGFDGSGRSCNCLKTVWEKQAKEEAEKKCPSKSESDRH